jgi:copper chaperone
MSETTMTVGGMKCGGCEKAVESALSALEGVASASADHTSGTVTVQADATVGQQTLAAAVVEAGYSVE